MLKADVTVNEKSVPALVDAARRINLLLGAYVLHEWGQAGCGWWTFMTHGGMGGVKTTLDHDGMEQTATAVQSQPSAVRKEVESALFWVREPRNLLLTSYRPDVLRIFSSYWNAFECLVEAVSILRPLPKVSKSEKEAQISQFFQERGGKLTAQNIQNCYREIVNPGLRGKARHALSVCFGSTGERYYKESFELTKRTDQLYDIRNAINHGKIDAEDPRERVRVEAKLRHLWIIVWRMFGYFAPFPVPVELHKVDRS